MGYIGLHRFVAVTGLTVREALRQPITLLLVLSCTLVSGLMPLFVAHQLGEPGRLARDSALAFHFVFGVLVAGYVGASALASELHSGTAATVLSKAVGREAFFLAKFAGVAVIVLLFSLCAAITTLLSERMAPRDFNVDWLVVRCFLAAPVASLTAAGLISFWRRRPFASLALGLYAASLAVVLLIGALVDEHGQCLPFGAGLNWRLVPASALITLALLLLAAVALGLSTRLRQPPVIATLCVLFLLGLMADALPHPPGIRGAALAALRTVVPDLQHFWMADALGRGAAIPLVYLARTASYAALYLAGVLCLGVVAFRAREV